LDFILRTKALIRHFGNRSRNLDTRGPTAKIKRRIQAVFY
jgi:hypothetical protein